MWIKIISDDTHYDYESISRRMGSFFILIGVFTSIYAIFSILSSHSIIGVTLMISGLISAYMTAKINTNIISSWIKSILLFASGLLFLLLNIATPSTLALLIGLFFVLQSLNNLYFLYITRKDATSLAWGINVISTLLFAYILLSKYTTISENMIALLVAVGLIIDGITIIFSGRRIYIRP